MKKLNFLFYLFAFYFSSFPLFSQINGRVIDAQTQQPLAYVNIGVLGKNMGSISNEDGTFQLTFSEIATADTLRFSAIGYESFDATSDWFQAKEKKIVSLKPITYELSSIEVTPFQIEAIIGENKKGKGGFGFSGDIGKGTEISTRISTNGKLYQLQSFHFHVKKTTYNNLLLRLKLYEIVNDKPGQNLLQEEVLIDMNGQKRGWITVNLGKNNIITQNDFVASLEFIKGASSTGSSVLLLSRGQKETAWFYRASSFDQWKPRPDPRGLLFYFDVLGR